MSANVNERENLLKELDEAYLVLRQLRTIFPGKTVPAPVAKVKQALQAQIEQVESRLGPTSLG